MPTDLRHVVTMLVKAGLRLAVAALLLACGAAVVPAEAQTGLRHADSVAAGVRAGDIINLWVWREKDLTGEFPVDAHGRVVLPMLGEIQAAGRSADSLVDDLRSRFAQFVTTPSIRITVLRRVTVQGQVARPGLYPVDATITVADAIALAGGITGGGDVRKVRLVRRGQVIVTQLGSETVVDRSAIQSGDEIFVPERSWFARNATTILWTTLSTATGVVATLLIR